jgi:plasmid stability protein
MEKINISVKGIPMDVYEQIKKRAQLNHRSINTEVKSTLTESVESNRVQYEVIAYKVRELRKRAKGTLPIEEVLKAIEEGRE